MKINNLIYATVLLGTSALFANYPPMGTLDVSTHQVRESGSVSLNWQVVFPPSNAIDELVEIDEELDMITLKTSADVDVRLLGSGYANQFGHAYVESIAKFSDEAGYLDFFNGFGDDVDATEILKSREKVKKGTSLDMTFRGSVRANRSTPVSERTFNDYRVMGQGHGGILILRNGDLAPAFSPERSNQLSAKTFLLPFLNSDMTRIQIGENDLVILVDLNRSSAAEGADYQDFVVLMTINEKSKGRDKDKKVKKDKK